MYIQFDGRFGLRGRIIKTVCPGLALAFATGSMANAQTEKFEVPQSEIARVKEAVALVACASRCSLDTKPFFQKFMEIEKKLCSFEQVAFIGTYFGAVVGQKLSERSQIPECDSIARQLRMTLEKLNATKFGSKPSATTDLFWYDLGPNGGVKRAVIYPVGEPDHCALILFFIDGVVGDFNIERVPEKLVTEKFKKTKWGKATGAARFPMAVSLVDSEIILGKTKVEVIEILGQPDGALLHEYGFEILK